MRRPGNCTSGTKSTVPTPNAEYAMPMAVDSRSRYQRARSAEAGTMPFMLTPMPTSTPMKR
jgi:hypothetical protein